MEKKAYFQKLDSAVNLGESAGGFVRKHSKLISVAVVGSILLLLLCPLYLLYGFIRKVSERKL